MADAELAGVVACLRAAPAEPTLERAQALLGRLDTETWLPDQVSPLIEEIEQTAQALQRTAGDHPTCLVRLKALPHIAGAGMPTGF